jgi:hypothetical protein
MVAPVRHGTMRRSWLGAALTLLAPVLLTLTIASNWLRWDVLPPETLSHHVRESLRQPAVRDELTRRITRAVSATDPRVAAAGPVVRTAVAIMVESRQFADIVDVALHQVRNAIIEGDSVGPTRFSDVEAQLTATLAGIDPSLAERIPTNWDTVVLDLRPDGPIVRSMRFGERLAAAWWLLLAATSAAFLARITLARDRRRAVAASSAAVAVVGVGVLIGRQVAGSVVRGLVTDRSTRAAIGAAFDVSTQGLLHIALGCLVGAAIVLAATVTGTVIPTAARRVARAVRRVGRTPTSAGARLARALVAIGLGAVAILAASRIGYVLAVGAGIGLAFAGTRLLVLSLPAAPDHPARSVRPRIIVAVCLIGMLTVPIVLLADARRHTRDPETALSCNGSVQLCGRRVDQVTFPATHNSMASADAGFLFPQQTHTIEAQLEAGIRGLLVDTQYGIPTGTGVVWTDLRAGDRASIVDEIGGDTLASIEGLRASLLPPSGTPDVYLCHALCELGATRAVDAFASIRRFLERNPAEVVILMIQDSTSPEDTVAALRAAGLESLAYTYTPTQPWPTLGTLIRGGTPLVVLSERHGGEPAWFQPAFSLAQDTTYSAASVADLTCAPNRGPTNAHLLLVNDWINRKPTDVADAEVVNARDFLLDLAQRCEDRRDRRVNILAVNFWETGNLLATVRELNDVPTT